MKIRVGDKVRVIDSETCLWSYECGPGAEGVVVSVDGTHEEASPPDYPIVVCITKPVPDVTSLPFDECFMEYCSDDLELVDAAIFDAIPASDDDNDEIIDLLRSRLAIGRQTYGHGVQATSGEYDWVRMSTEEALDLAVYLAAKLIEIQRKERGDAK